MAKMNWDTDRRRRMIAPQRREAAIRFVDSIVAARTGPMITEPVKPRKRRRLAAKPLRRHKPKAPKLHRIKPPPTRKKVPVDWRETMLEQRRADARAARTAGIIQHPARPPQPQSFEVEYRPIGPRQRRPPALVDL